MFYLFGFSGRAQLTPDTLYQMTSFFQKLEEEITAGWYETNIAL